MQLGHIRNAIEVGSLQRLASMRMSPKMALKLHHYLKNVSSEAQFIEDQRVKLLRQVTGIKEGNIELKPDNPEFGEFIQRFNEVLVTDSELKPFEKGLYEVLEVIGDGQDDVLSVQDLGLLEPFFDGLKVVRPEDG